MPIFGTDCSDFDWGRGPMDVAAAVRDGMVFFTHKATEGTKTQHVHYGEALNRARAAGMPFMGAYFVPRTPGSGGHGSIQAQVDYFLSYIDQQTPWWRSMREFFIQVDTEHWGYDDVDPRYGAQACALLRAQAGKFVIHYAPRWAYGDTIPGGEPLWASSYGNNPVAPYRQAYPGDGSSGWAPYSGRTPKFLQYGSKATIGRQPSCDINAFRGTIDQLRALITGGNDMAISDEKVIGQETLPEYLMRIERLLWWPIPGIAKDVAALTTALTKVLENQGATQAEIEQLLARPAVALTDDQVAALGADISAVLVARPDNPLGEADIPTIQAAIDRYIRAHFGQPAQAAAANEPAQG